MLHNNFNMFYKSHFAFYKSKFKIFKSKISPTKADQDLSNMFQKHLYKVPDKVLPSQFKTSPSGGKNYTPRNDNWKKNPTPPSASAVVLFLAFYCFLVNGNYAARLTPRKCKLIASKTVLSFCSPNHIFKLVWEAGSCTSMSKY